MILHIDNNKQYFNEIIFEIMNKIIDLPCEREKTIAELINYNPENEFVEKTLKDKKLPTKCWHILRILNLRIYVVKETKLLYNKHIKSWRRCEIWK